MVRAGALHRGACAAACRAQVSGKTTRSFERGDAMSRSACLIATLALAACGGDSSPTAPSAPAVSFFVTSATSVTGNLGGLAGADATCQRLAPAAGHTGRVWRAYLSV